MAVTKRMLAFDGSQQDWYQLADGSLAPIGAAVLVDVNGNPLLGAAAALGDADANPTTIRIGADLQLWDSILAQWARAQVVNPTGDVATGVQAAGGRSVPITLLSALAITDTLQHASSIVDCRHFTRGWTIDLRTTLNQPITSVQLWADNQATVTGPVLNVATQSITTGAHFTPDAAATGAANHYQVPVMGRPWQSVQFAVTCAVAPTTGTVTAILRGTL